MNQDQKYQMALRLAEAILTMEGENKKVRAAAIILAYFNTINTITTTNSR
mgnify:FL=1